MNHTEFEYVKNNEIAMVFIHGILGSPVQFKEMALYMHNFDIDCYCVLLPGHGHDTKKFRECTKEDWIQFINTKCSELRKRYKKLIIIGHSMGALLALKEANEELADLIILMNAPIIANFTLKQHQIGFKVLWGKEEDDDEFVKAYRESFSVDKCKFHEYLLWLKPFLSLLTLMFYTRKILSQVKAPTLIIQSKRDETVHYKSAKIIYDNIKSIKKEIVMLEKSGHTYYEKSEQEIIWIKVKEFLKDLLI